MRGAFSDAGDPDTPGVPCKSKSVSIKEKADEKENMGLAPRIEHVLCDRKRHPQVLPGAYSRSPLMGQYRSTR